MPGCFRAHSLGPGSFKNRYAEYGVIIPSKTWTERKFRGAEIFLEHSPTKSFIFLNSQCEKVSDSPLEALTSQLLVGFTDIKIISQKSRDIAERGALITELEARVDGVKRYFQIAVLRKNRCVFDAILTSDQKHDAVVHDFDQIISSFWAKADL